MANPGEPLRHYAHYLDATARLFGWQVAWEPDLSARMSQGDWTVHAFFDHDGACRYGKATGTGTGTGNLELTLPEAVTTLEHHGSPVPPPR